MVRLVGLWYDKEINSVKVGYIFFIHTNRGKHHYRTYPMLGLFLWSSIYYIHRV